MRLSTKYSRLLSTAVYRTSIQKFGYNADSDTGDDVWSGSAAYTGFLTAAVTIEAISSATADTAAGTGARTIRVEGLDANWNFQTADITMAGQSASSATTESFIRVFRAFVTSAGTGATNAGTVTIRVSSAGASLAVISITEPGQTTQAIFTVPAKHVGVLKDVLLTGSSSQPISFILLARRGADVTNAPVRTIAVYSGIDDAGQERGFEPGSIVLPEKSDIWVRVLDGANSALSSAEFDLELIGYQGCTRIPD